MPRTTEVPSPDGKASAWSLSMRMSFRFAFLFFVLFAILARQFPLSLLMGMSSIASLVHPEIDRTLQEFWTEVMKWQAPYLERWQELTAKFGEQVLGLVESVDVSRSGSGDKIADLNQIVLIALMSAGVTLIWTVLSRRRSHPKLAHWLWIGARIFLAETMFSYGFAKVIKTQFAEPSLSALVTPLGDLAPMTLVWTFMGFSTPYTIFAGAGEVLGGLLLAFRRTATLGALVTFGVMINVVMLNYCYDVPVKFYSTYYTVLAIGIALPDAKRLLDALVLQRAVPARDMAGPFSNATLNHAVTGLTWLWIGTTITGSVLGGLRSYSSFGDGRTKPELYGVYVVEEFRRDGEVIPARLDDRSRWHRLIIDYPQSAFIVTASGEWIACSASYEIPGSIALQPTPRFSRTVDRFPKWAAARQRKVGFEMPLYSIEEIGTNLYRLRGEYCGRTIEVTLKRKTRDDFELTNRGFHWLNPLPYQRPRRS